MVPRPGDLCKVDMVYLGPQVEQDFIDKCEESRKALESACEPIKKKMKPA